MKIYFRLGDQGDYEEALDPYDLGQALFNEKITKVFLRGIFGITADGYEGDNYISCYYGDDVKTPKRSLTKEEIFEINRILEN